MLSEFIRQCSFCSTCLPHSLVASTCKVPASGVTTNFSGFCPGSEAVAQTNFWFARGVAGLPSSDRLVCRALKHHFSKINTSLNPQQAPGLSPLIRVTPSCPFLHTSFTRVAQPPHFFTLSPCPQQSHALPNLRFLSMPAPPCDGFSPEELPPLTLLPP